MLHVDRVPSPIGTLLAVTTDAALVMLEFEDDGTRAGRSLAAARARFVDAPLVEASDPLGVAGALRAYLAGDLAALDGLAVDAGGSAFQRRVWAMLRTIPAGTTTSYGALAKALGVPGSSRAVGLANSTNPIGVVVPCHRVIGADGSLTGYGGGLERKRWLLEHEGVLLRMGA